MEKQRGAAVALIEKAGVTRVCMCVCVGGGGRRIFVLGGWLID